MKKLITFVLAVLIIGVPKYYFKKWKSERRNQAATIQETEYNVRLAEAYSALPASLSPKQRLAVVRTLGQCIESHERTSDDRLLCAYFSVDKRLELGSIPEENKAQFAAAIREGLALEKSRRAFADYALKAARELSLKG